MKNIHILVLQFISYNTVLNNYHNYQNNDNRKSRTINILNKLQKFWSKLVLARAPISHPKLWKAFFFFWLAHAVHVWMDLTGFQCVQDNWFSSNQTKPQAKPDSNTVCNATCQQARTGRPSPFARKGSREPDRLSQKIRVDPIYPHEKIHRAHTTSQNRNFLYDLSCHLVGPPATSLNLPHQKI